MGAEALSPAVDQNGFAGFLFEEATWPHVTLQFGGRIDHSRYTPAGETERTFTTGSGSGGILFRPAAADDAVTIAVSLARSARYPALEELFYFGPHPGNFAFEIGAPDIRPEHALGLDVAFRWRSARASGEISYFRNDIRSYLFRRPVSDAEFEERLPEFAERFPGRGIGEEEPGAEEEEGFPVVEYVSADSLLQGIEAHGDFQLTAHVTAEIGLDYVRGALKDDRRAAPANSSAAIPRRASVPLQRVPGRWRIHCQRHAGPGIRNRGTDRRQPVVEAVCRLLVPDRQGGQHDYCTG